MNPDRMKIKRTYKKLETERVQYPRSGAITTNRAPSDEVRRILQLAFARALRAQRGL